MEHAARRALVVEDDRDVAAVVETALRDEGYEVVTVHSGVDAVQVTGRVDLDVAVLDVDVPPPDGFALIRLLRSRGSDAGILLLTGTNTVEDRVRALDMGADDFLVKPFDIEELCARVRAITRRRIGDGRHADVLALGDLTIDSETNAATVGAEPMDLPPTESALLRSLVARPGRAVPRSVLLDEVWGREETPGDRIVDVYVSYVRRRLEERSSNVRIETVRGVGYRARVMG